MAEESGNENLGLNCTLEYFLESKTVNEILDDVVNAHSSDHSSEVAHEKLKQILNQYIDQSHLLDPYIEKFLCKMIDYIKDTNLNLAVKQEIFRYMFLLINVRGYKVIVRLLPHEVTDLELALSLLEQQYDNHNLKWETRYCLHLWLSIIVMIPFDMARLDVPDVIETTASRLLACCKKGLMTTDKSRDATAFLCARFVTRGDIKKIYLNHIIEWACDELVTENRSQSWRKFGPLMALASILKHGKREDLLPYTEKIFNCIITTKCLEDTYRLSRKFAIKIVQRIGLCYLRVRIAAWRYQRGCRSLALNLGTDQQQNAPVLDEYNEQGDIFADEIDELPKLVEDVVGELLKALRDEDITTRWSAAKGIGRVTNRLSADFSDEIVGNILTKFSPRESSCVWNGACLALAELGAQFKRGLLLPGHLPPVVKVLLKALVYEETHGFISAGTYVRDSACYTCWSLARAYDPEVFKPYVNEIAGGLLIVSSFDREMNCRKAASAAFQEHVGRQGTFPHGIEILTIADYFAVSVRKNAYLNVSTHVAQFPEYTRQMIDHLVEHKIGYWDSEIRDLTSKALFNLVSFDPAYMMTKLKYIMKNLYSVNLNMRHGSIISIAEIIHALSNVEHQHLTYDEDVVHEIKTLVPKLESQNMYKGVGGDLMKEATCFLITKCSLGKFPIDENVIARWRTLIDSCVPYDDEKVRLSAAAALSALVERHYVKEGQPIDEICKPIIDICRAETVSNSSETSRIGYATVLGKFSKYVLDKYLKEVIESLIECATRTGISAKWVYSRKAATESLTAIWKIFSIDEEGKFGEANLKLDPVPILKTLLNNLADYTVDRRGDIGSVVRAASLKGLQIIVPSTCRINKTLLPKYLIEDIIVAVAKQALDKISKIRLTSSSVFLDILNSDISEIENLEEIRRLFSENNLSEMNWTRESETFPLFVQLMNYPKYTRALLSAFIRCIGSVTESLARYSTLALTDYLRNKSVEQLEQFCDMIVNEFEKCAKDDKTTKTMFIFVERMFACSVFQAVIKNPQNSFAMNIYNLSKNVVSRTRDSEKLTVSVEIFCQLLQVGGKLTKNALSTLCTFLCHQMIWFRKTVALRLTEAVMMYADVCGLTEESESQAMKILTEFDWENGSTEDIRETRNELCVLFDIPIPKIATP